ncbi:hypothetical protein GCM10009716_34180 [Streptomyces sodiiphilus]|uniref:Uncharacterized protein n=1 Tax=Streptomyces sodiiphilus TaxID=226217 RepID=A0ABN2PIR1_9ACTN
MPGTLIPCVREGGSGSSITFNHFWCVPTLPTGDGPRLADWTRTQGPSLRDAASDSGSEPSSPRNTRARAGALRTRRCLCVAGRPPGCHAELPGADSKVG